MAHLAYAHYEAAGTLWRQEAAIHAATVDAAAAHSRANHTFPTHANVTHVTHEFEPDAANSAPFRRLLSDESVSSIGSKGSTSTINSVSTRSSTSSSTTIGGSSHTNHDDGCGALPDAGEALAARVQVRTASLFIRADSIFFGGEGILSLYSSSYIRSLALKALLSSVCWISRHICYLRYIGRH